MGSFVGLGGSLLFGWAVMQSPSLSWNWKWETGICSFGRIVTLPARVLSLSIMSLTLLPHSFCHSPSIRHFFILRFRGRCHGSSLLFSSPNASPFELKLGIPNFIQGVMLLPHSDGESLFTLGEREGALIGSFGRALHIFSTPRKSEESN